MGVLWSSRQFRVIALTLPACLLYVEDSESLGTLGFLSNVWSSWEQTLYSPYTRRVNLPEWLKVNVDSHFVVWIRDTYQSKEWYGYGAKYVSLIKPMLDMSESNCWPNFIRFGDEDSLVLGWIFVMHFRLRSVNCHETALPWLCIVAQLSVWLPLSHSNKHALSQWMLENSL